ncbi:hypothetical protein ACFWOJ_12645 [Streptomyces sp. NPDC058439]|uniref:hypothetical protein n=1 Tax=Streptomyces sp. NPDC058439 TaxID=3346500 RepID=UPI00364A4A74
MTRPVMKTAAITRFCATGRRHRRESATGERSACSHQLRLLRNLGLVTGERRGRSVIYALYDNHVAELLDQALFHVEHLRLGLHDTPAEEAVGAGDGVAAGDAVATTVR